MNLAVRSLVVSIGCVAISSCATTPKEINLPQSTLKAPMTSVEGSAIAFQASDGQCNNSSFEISPLLDDGKYGMSKKLEISSSTFKLKSKSLNQKKFASSRKQLYVKTLPPGKYVVTRLRCYRSDGVNTYSYFTKPERIDIFAEFEVEPAKTNYIGAIEVTKSYAANAPVFRVSDKSQDAKVFFDEHYADKAAPMHIKLAKKTAPNADDTLNTFLKLLEESK